ncbi:MAG: DUF3560 domain-containing protein [Sphingobacteriales bacterium]|nr:DUF3560 domain-containing protein [Sphingobacteriales bacterium]OJW01951.1 MAG: hypothetical protein BGO52_00260 [Sphingobacteriales bacterium 44-61]
MKHDFEERRQNRIDNAKKQAEKNKEKAIDLHREAKEMASHIPFGQPIHVGHHSEQRDRNFRKKIHQKFDKAFKTWDKAEYYENKADTIENSDAIFSDDPQALAKLKDKLAGLQRNQEFMKAANKCIRQKNKEAFLQLPFATPELWEQLNTPDVMGQIGFASYSLRNNNSNIASVKQRIAWLEKLAVRTSQETTINTVRILENMEADRVQLIFPAKPLKELRKAMGKRGFHWSKREGAWQRHYSPVAVSLAKEFAAQYQPEAKP